MKTNYKISIFFAAIIIILLAFNYAVNYYKQTPILKIEFPKKIDLPADYKSLFNKKTQARIKHIYSKKYKTKETNPVSYIKIDSFGIDIFKFKCSNSLLKIINIKDIQPPKGSVILNYYSFGSPNIERLYRGNLTNEIDTIYIRTTKSIDTVHFSQNFIILKGTMGNLQIKVDNSKQGYDQYFDDETYLNKALKYYLIWIQKEENIYELFIETKKFDDKKILSLFK